MNLQQPEDYDTRLNPTLVWRLYCSMRFSYEERVSHRHFGLFSCGKSLRSFARDKSSRPVPRHSYSHHHASATNHETTTIHMWSYVSVALFHFQLPDRSCLLSLRSDHVLPDESIIDLHSGQCVASNCMCNVSNEKIFLMRFCWSFFK